MVFLLNGLLQIVFLLYLMKRLLANLEKTKFSILDDIRETTAKQSTALTLSIGVGIGSTSLNRTWRTCTVESRSCTRTWW